MTQLVELQRAQPKFAAAGVKLYAVSYDDAEALADFTKHHNITYPLLSDEGSKVIREYGLLNYHVTEEQVPFYGIPFPGTYVVDEDGVIVEKFFQRNVAARESAESFIDGALGEILLGEEEPSANGGDDDIQITATFHGGGGSLKAAVMRHLIVRFELANGLHIYDDPVPNGMVATRIEVEGPEGLHSGDMRKPPTSVLHLPALDAELQVWDGRVDFAIPIWVDDRIASLVEDRGLDQVEITVRIHYQACDDHTCRIPQSETLSVTVPITGYVAHHLAGRLRGATATTMNSTKYMQRLIARGLRRSPLQGLRYLWRSRQQIKRGPAGSRRRKT